MRSTLLSLALVSLFSFNAHAYLSLAESGELVEPGLYQIGIEPQFLTNNGGGTNVNLLFDAGLNDSTSARLNLGVGSVDFNAFGSVKFIPFPDVDNQPAIGVRLGAGFTKDNGENLLNFQLAPLLSKKVDVDMFGVITPYIAVPITYVIAKESNYTASNFVVGSEFKSAEVPEFTFGAELGFEMNESYSYLSLFLTYPFEAKGR